MIKRRKPIRRVSLKRGKVNRQYMKLREEYLSEHPYCQWWLSKHGITEEVAKKCNGNVVSMTEGYAAYVPRATEIHHMKGRGRYLLDTVTWLAVSQSGHRYIHDHPKESYERGWMLNRNTIQ